MYAEGTTVPAEKSRAEIEGMLRRYGAVQFVSGWDGGKAMIGFSASGRQIKFVLQLPAATDRAFTHKQMNGWAKARPADQVRRLHEAEIRRRWRALALVIKAKLESVASGIATFEEEFMSWVVLPDGRTVGELVHPEIARAYEHGTMPTFLPALPPAGESGA